MEKIKIIVVEDELIIAQSIKMALNQMGYVVSSIMTNGEEAIRKVQSDTPDIVLMDIMLAGQMDGIQTAKKILEEHDVPVVFLTAYTDQATLEKAKQTAPYGYVVKPYEETQLNIAIEIALQRHGFEKERNKLLKELQEAFEKINLLQELIPICCKCKKIRDDDGYWQQIDNYFTQNTTMKFTHGYCPRCRDEELRIADKMFAKMKKIETEKSSSQS